MAMAFRGRDGDEAQDYAYNFTNPRRRSNSSGHLPRDLKTKFEKVDQEPVFEEELHGAPITTAVTETTVAAITLPTVDGDEVDKEGSATSTSGGSIEEVEDHAKNI